MEPGQVAQKNLLFDFYGGLLTGRQQEVLVLYYEENLTLAEIAKEFRISRQGVHDTLKAAERSLEKYEEKLGLIEKFKASRQGIKRIDQIIDQIIKDSARDQMLSGQLQKIKTVINKLD